MFKFKFKFKFMFKYMLASIRRRDGHGSI